ncbi:interferon-induced very large GTPase 1-like [Lethenteron reissneri]|uniref:interferon-induced very large GTPase 1-like n=1 Tax=Lethenteron reissneri TaxID=7753 RepID=UPI002AB77134|nr:interferon-induced very large GTPase 1-like [Lethenteron reissneri]XP_061434817.1 interferon-induced very large GTPase 1-like [Lethenteron reissneri]
MEQRDAGALTQDDSATDGDEDPVEHPQQPRFSSTAALSAPRGLAHCAKNKSTFQTLLEDLDLWKYYPQKLSLKDVLQVSESNTKREQPNSLQDVAMHFLHGIFAANSNSRTTEFSSGNVLAEAQPAKPESEFAFLTKRHTATPLRRNSISILDLTAAVFLCADQCLQQAIMVKMSLCQFALPLLLPDSNKGKLTFLLWAMRSVTHIWRPHEIMGSRGYVEDSMARAQMPMISFLRIGNCKVSKSEVINSFLSNGRHDVFVHRNMIFGDSPRKIANGVVEICFSLPRGNEHSDLFQDIVAVFNLRGDAKDSLTQFQFLKRTSGALFVFVEEVGESERTFLTSSFEPNSKPFLVLDSERTAEEETSRNLLCVCKHLKLEENNVFLGEDFRRIAFKETFKKFVVNAVRNIESKKENLQEAIGTATALNIVIDEGGNDLRIIRESVKNVTDYITEHGTCSIKEMMLPRQGKLWRDWADLDKEQWRLNKISKRSCEEYRATIEMEKRKLREQQSKLELSPPMEMYFHELMTPSKTNLLFLQCLKVELDSLSRTPGLLPSLGVEHFMRELAQIYEASKACDAAPPGSQALPSVMAQLLLDGFPMELLDGDASCIPMDWVTDVLDEVRRMLGEEVRVLVLSVLGVQSTGKSTLLNIMFGLQFAVSSGRCTRGMFAHLVRVDDLLRKELRCDFFLVIDSEGLSAPEGSPHRPTDERDAELATLLIGLSDMVLFNLRMENAEELKGILRTALHAIVRMIEAGRKPSCLFIHQCSGDLSAHNKNAEGRESILRLLEESAAVAMKLEGRELVIKQFSEIMEYDVVNDNCYLPELWTSGLLVKPISSEYSDKVLDLRKNILEKFKSKKSTHTLSEFSHWLNIIWTAMKKEMYIFSFKNFHVINPYNKLCSEYSAWEGKLSARVDFWLNVAENRISNSKPTELDELCAELEGKLKNEFSENEGQFKELLQDIFEKSEDSHLLLKYQKDFLNSYGMFTKNLHLEALEKYENKHFEALVKHARRENNQQSYEFVENHFTQRIVKGIQQRLQNYKNKHTELSKISFQDDFNRIWSESVSLLENKEIEADIEKRLSKDDNYRKRLSAEPLCDLGKTTFVIRNTEHKLSTSEMHRSWTSISTFVGDVVRDCTAFIEGYAKTKISYSSKQWDELLAYIDSLLNAEYKGCNAQLKVDIKLYVCSIAVKAFTRLDKALLEHKLSDLKNTALDLFGQMCQSGDERQNIAAAFCQCFIKPALVIMIHQQLGTRLVKMIREKSDAFSSRKHLQMHVLLHLLMEEDFVLFIKFISSHEDATHDWVKNYVIQVCKQYKLLSLHNICLEKKNMLEEVISKIENSVMAVKAAQPVPATAADLFRSLKKFLAGDIVFQHVELLRIFDVYPLVDTQSLERLSAAVVAQLRVVICKVQPNCSDTCDVEKTLKDLRMRPHRKLLWMLRGCGQQCPLCGAPCDRGGGNHREHAATVHYPQGLMGRRHHDGTFMCDVCTTSMARKKNGRMGEHTFYNADTGNMPVKFNNLRNVNKLYKDWNIPPDPDVENPLFWKLVLHQFNEQLAQHYGVGKAEIPAEWGSVTKQCVEDDLRERYFGQTGVVDNVVKLVKQEQPNDHDNKIALIKYKKL